MGTTKDLILVYPSMDSMVLKERTNIMLTPQFYTLKKEALPVKYAYQAKKIAPSLFDGLLEDGKNYEYLVFKEENWVFIAYDVEGITDFLASKGIVPAMVAKLFFIEQAKHHLSSPLAIGEKEAVVLLDDSVVVVPKAALSDEEQPLLRFGKHFTPKKGVSMQGEMGSFLSKKHSYALAALFLLFAGMFWAEGLRYGDGKSSQEELDTLYTTYPALQSSYTRKEVVSTYRTLDSSERKKRSAIKNISSVIFKGVTLSSLHMDDTKFKTTFLCVSKEVSKKLQALVKKYNYSVKPIKNSYNIEIEGTL